MKNRENTLGANKQMAFLNTTKLAVALKRTLMVLTLCIISTLCIQAEESTTEAPDSVTISGPKKSHWTSTGYIMGFIPYTQHNNNIDYAQVIAKIQVFDGTNDITSTVGNIGTVIIDKPTTSGTIETNSPFDKDSKSAYIYWNCNIKGSNNNQDKLEAAHKLTIELKVTDEEGDDFVFDRWEKQINNGASEDLGGAVDIPLTQTCIIGGGGTGFTEYGNAQNNTYENTGNRYTVTYIAKFIPRKTECKVTFAAAKGGGGYTFQNGTDASTAATGQTVTLDGKTQTILTTTPSNDNELFAWYVSYDEGATYSILSKTTPYTCTFEKDAIVYAQFIPSDAALFIIKDGDGTEYWNLNEACEKAPSFSNVVLPKNSGTLYPLVEGELCINPEGETTPYTIPSGVTLLIPYDDDNSIYTKPEQKHESNASPSSKPTCYCLLTLHDLCTISVDGTLNIAANIFSAYGGNYCSGSVFSKYGRLDMKKDSKININSSAKLYCWGFITGTEGLVTVKGEVNEMFQMHNPGGGQLSKWKNKALFITQYYIQNIETPMRIYSGATETVHATVYIYTHINTNATLVGEDGLFRLIGEESYFEKRYDPITDRQIFEINGSAELNYLSLTVLSYSISTETVPLPISNNITILSKVLPKEESSTLTCNYDVALLPGSELIIDKGVKVENKASIYIYDQEEWKEGFAGLNSDLLKPVRFSPTKNITRTKDDLIDAKFEINGTLNIASNGAIYTTIDNERTRKGSANICSAGTGIIKYNGKAGTETETYLYAKNDLSTPVTIPITAAQLHNDEEMNSTEPYTETSSAVAGDEFWYVASLGRWVKNEFGLELDIVDADNTKKTLTINANGWASSGWPYTINGTEYGKDDKAGKEKYRQADRTLVIPYTGTSGASLPIAVLDKDGKPICRHIYKVPFVYTGSEDLSAMDASSIVFVHSGTLTISGTDVKAAAIYVSPGAELNVTGTLTVGKLVLRTTPWQAAVLTIGTGGSIKLAEGGQVYYSRIAPNKSTITDLHGGTTTYNSARYYQFGLPLSCSISSVTMSNTGKFGESNTPYGNTWLLKSYNESKRAENGISSSGDNWEALESTGTITAGVGYEMFSNSNYYREFYFPVNLSEAKTQVSVQYTKGTKEEHNGWNIITSPLTSKATVTIGDPATAIMVCWLNKDGSYSQVKPTVIPPAIPFSYQASANGNLNFAVPAPAIAAAPRKQSATEALTETEWVHLYIFDAYGEGDETSLFVHPTRFEQTYKTGIDMAKQSLTASRPIIYSTHAYGDMAFAGVADSLLENGIDLVVYSPSAQELTFSLRENKFLNRLEYLWLADNETGARTDLLMDDYTFRADAGTAKGRFVLNGRFKAPQISTGIGNTQTDYNIYAIGNNIAISGVEQGTPIYVFDAVGHMIYTTAATTAEVIVPAPCAGVYMLTIGGQTAKLVINK